MSYEKALNDAYERGYNAGLKDNGGYAVLGEGWRDARKELPKCGKYLLCDEFDNVFSGTLILGIWYKDWNEGMGSYEVSGIIAWMPLPDPPAFT